MERGDNMNDQRTAGREDVARLLEASKGTGFLGLGRTGRRVAAAVLAAGILAAGYAFLRAGGKEQAPRYRTETVTRGNLTVTVSATGNLQPTNQVDVGSEISGTIAVVLVDDNDRVTKGQVLARLDTSSLEQKVLKSRAALEAARAAVAQMRATVEESRAELARLRQVAALSGGKVPSKTELDSAEASLKRAEANEASAVASVGQAEATLKSDETDLSKATIRSPINGVILERKIEPGQTVAASMETPVLFTIAEDLTKMELEVDVDEADVGSVREGQSATFTVDAWPNRKYPARIKRLSYGSQTEENVVTYPAILTVSNADLSLRPGMTATAEIVTAKRENALLVPNAALRFAPASAAGAPKEKGRGLVGSLMPGPPRTRPSSNASNGAAGKGGAQSVYVLKNGVPVAVPVTVGVSDGKTTEVISGDLAEGTPVITESAGE
jgi:HlyD family secretion protein